MAEVTTNHDSFVLPEHQQAAAELVAILERQLPPLKLLVDFPADSHETDGVLAWLREYASFYNDDEELQRAIEEVDKLDPMERAIATNEITKDTRRCQPMAEKLYDTVSQIVTLYDTVVAVYDRQLDAAAVRSEATALLEEGAQRAYDETLRQLPKSLTRIFPPHVAEVNAPESCAVNVPTVKRWQRKHGIADPAVADREYMRLVAKAREGVEQDFAETGRVAFTVTAKVSDDLRVMLPLSVYDELHRCVTRMEDADDGSQTMDDQLEQQLIIAQRCAAALQSHAELSLETLHDRYVREAVGAQLDEAAAVARQVATQQFMDVLAERLVTLKVALDAYTVAPGLAAGGLREVVTKRKRQKVSAPAVNRVRTQEVRDITLRPGDELFVDNGQFPWLDGEDIIRSVIAVDRGVKGNIAIIDMRTPATKAIEHKMAGYETEEKRRGLLPIITTKLQLIGQMAAGADTMLSKLKHLDDRDTERYPLPISYWGSRSRNQARIYISLVDVAGMSDGEMKDELMAGGVDRAVLFIGACDKNHQSDLMEEFKRFSW